MGPWSIGHNCADMTCSVDRFHRLLPVFFNGQNSNKTSRWRMIDVDVLVRWWRAASSNLNMRLERQTALLLADGELLNGLWLVI